MALSRRIRRPPSFMPNSSILHLIPTLEGGGAERQLRLLAIAQVQRGRQTHVAIRRGGVHLKAMEDAGVHIHRLGNLRTSDPRLLWKTAALVGKLKPAIIQTWLPPMDILGGTIALAMRQDWILSERVSGAFYQEIPRAARLRLLIGARANAVVANSHEGARYWMSRRGANDVDVIPNALDIEGIIAAQLNPVAQARRCFLVVGRFNRQKALDVIVRAVALIPETTAIDVVMMGVGPERLAIEADIARLGLGRRITLRDYDPDWWRLMPGACALISMSIFEGNPNVALEAMAGGCPVILSDIPEHREIADPSSAVFVPVNEAAGLASAMRDLIGDETGARQRAAAAKHRTRTRTVDAMADAYDLVYARALQPSRNRRNNP